MVESILEIIKKVAIFMMIGKVILNLGIGKEYEKYTKLIISLMAVLQVWSGMKSMAQTFTIEGIISEKQQFYKTWEEETRKFEEELYHQQNKIEELWQKEAEIDKEVQADEELDTIEENRNIKIENIHIP